MWEYLSDKTHIHSSGKDHGHNGIAISQILGSDPVSIWYASQLRGAARIIKSYKNKHLLGNLCE